MHTYRQWWHNFEKELSRAPELLCRSSVILSDFQTFLSVCCIFMQFYPQPQTDTQTLTLLSQSSRKSLYGPDFLILYLVRLLKSHCSFKTTLLVYSNCITISKCNKLEDIYILQQRQECAEAIKLIYRVYTIPCRNQYLCLST